MNKQKIAEALNKLIHEGSCDQWLQTGDFELHISAYGLGLDTYKIVFTVYHENSSLLSDIELFNHIKEGDCLKTHAESIVQEIEKLLHAEITIIQGALLALGAKMNN